MNCFIFILIFACGTAVFAQTARELFDPPAKEYILGNTPVASNLVRQALEKYPEDERLQKLKKLIEQQQEQQNQQQDQNQQQQEQDNQRNEPQDQEQSDSQDQQQDAQQESSPTQEQPLTQPRQAGQMTPEEAQQLLDAMRQDEQAQRADLQPYLGAPVRVDKDW